MENVLINNQRSVEGLFINYHRPAQKEIDFLDLTSFILDTAIHNLEDMGFLSESDYHEGNFDNCQYGTNEEVWEVLFNATNVADYEEFEEKFESVVAWEDNDNTCIAKIAGVEYAILRM